MSFLSSSDISSSLPRGPRSNGLGGPFRRRSDRGRRARNGVVEGEAGLREATGGEVDDDGLEDEVLEDEVLDLEEDFLSFGVLEVMLE